MFLSMLWMSVTSNVVFVMVIIVAAIDIDVDTNIAADALNIAVILTVEVHGAVYIHI